MVNYSIQPLQYLIRLLHLEAQPIRGQQTILVYGDFAHVDKLDKL